MNAQGMMPFSGPMNGAQEYYQDSANIAEYRAQAGINPVEAGLLTASDLADRNLSVSAELLENLALESGNWLGATGLEYLQDQRQAVAMMQMKALEILNSIERDLGPHFADIARNGNETVNFFLGYHWTTQDEKEITRKGLKPYSWPSFRPLVNAVLGEAVAQRADYRLVAANERSEQRVDVANKAMRWYAQSNGITNIKSDLTFDALVYGFSVAGTGNHPMNPLGAVRTMRCRPQEFLIDLNTATDCSFANSKYVVRKYWVDRVQLAAEFPEWAELILRPTGLMVSTTGFESEHIAVRPKAKVPVGENRQTGQYDPALRGLYSRMLFKRELYIRRWTPRLVVTDPFEGKTYPCKSQDEAAQQKALLEKHYIETGVFAQLTPELREVIFQAVPAQVEVIDQLIFIGDQLVRVNSDSEGGIPYTFCAPEYRDGDVTSYFDHAKGPQRWEDRLMADIDNLKAGAKGGTVSDRSKIVGMENATAEMLASKFNESNWHVTVDSGNDPAFDVSKVIAYVNPQSEVSNLAPLLNYAAQINRNAYGGPNALGMSAFAGQSGKSADELRRAGSTLTANVFDKMAFCDKKLGMRALYCLGTLHPATLMRVYDEDLRPEFFSLLTNGMESLSDYDFDVELKEIVASPSEKQARLARIENLLGYYPQLIEHALPFILKNADIDYDERQAMVQGVAEDRKARSDAAAQQAKMAQDEIDIKRMTAQESLYIKGRAQADAELNKPKVTIGIKYEPGPMGVADVLHWAAYNVPGMSPDPNFILADQTARALLQQGILTMQQVEEWEHTPPEQKQALMEQVKVKRGYPTAKDAANRATREVRSGNAA